PLDPALCLRGVGADDLDGEFGQGAPKLGYASVGATGTFAGHSEDAVLVAVERHWPAVVPEVTLRGIKVVEGRFGSHEPELHQPPGGVVDVDEQRAALAAPLEPVVVGPVNLNELPEALSPRPRLMGLGRLISA